MEFLPLEKYSVDKKKKKPAKVLKRSIESGVSKKPKKFKKSNDGETRKLFNSEIDDNVLEKKSVEKSSSNETAQQAKGTRDNETKKKIQVPRLFVNMKKVIQNEEEVKEIHPDVISVRFPRKKRSRWCWAIFGSEKKAAEALTELKTRNDIIVAKPRLQSKETSEKKTKTFNSKLKKSIKSKIREAWK